MSESTKQRVYGYIRVSKKEQEISGLSIEAQYEKITAYCGAYGLELVGMVKDTGSGKNLKREGIQALFGKARAGELDGIVCLKIDRMFRHTVDALLISEEFDKIGIGLHFIQERIDTKTAIGKMFFTLTAAFAEMERGFISERTKMGLGAKAARGERMGGIEYGYTIEHKGSQNLIPVADEQAILNHIRIMRNDGKPAHEIAEALNRMGKKNRRGNEWTESNVCYILRKKNKTERATA